jgi:hypothetical protein
MSIILATLIAIHGLAHMVGFAAPFGYLKEPLPEVLIQRLGLGTGGMKALGVVWLLTAMFFVVAAVGLIRRDAWWTTVALAGCAMSAVLTAMYLPYAKIGLVVDAVLIAFIIANRSHQWILPQA